MQTYPLRIRINVNNELAVNERIPQRHHRILVVGKEKATELPIGVMSINLKCSLSNQSPSVN